MRRRVAVAWHASFSMHRSCPVFRLRAAPLVGVDRRDVNNFGHGVAHRHRRPHRPGRAAGGVHVAAHPQAGVRHPTVGADLADASIGLHVLAGRAHHRHRDQRDLARPRQRGPVAVRHLRRRRRDRAARHVRLLPGICGRVAATTAETAQAQGEEATPRSAKSAEDDETCDRRRDRGRDGDVGPEEPEREESAEDETPAEVTADRSRTRRRGGDVDCRRGGIDGAGRASHRRDKPVEHEDPDTDEADATAGRLRNRRPSGKSSPSRRRRRSRGGVAVED